MAVKRVDSPIQGPLNLLPHLGFTGGWFSPQGTLRILWVCLWDDGGLDVADVRLWSDGSLESGGWEWV